MENTTPSQIKTKKINWTSKIVNMLLEEEKIYSQSLG